MLLLLTVGAYAAPISGYTVASTVPVSKRYQFYEGVGGGTTLEIDVLSDIGRPSGLGYVTNNTGADLYLHINYHLDAGETMKKIRIPR